MEETFNVGNPTRENIDLAFKNLIFYVTASTQLDIYKEQKEDFEKVLVEINTILATYVNKESLVSINEEKLQIFQSFKRIFKNERDYQCVLRFYLQTFTTYSDYKQTQIGEDRIVYKQDGR